MLGDDCLRYCRFFDSHWTQYHFPTETHYKETPNKIMEKKYTGKKFTEILHEEGFLLVGFSFLLGHSGSSLLNSIVNGLVMPFFTVMMDEESWEHATVQIGRVQLKWGDPLSDLIHTIVVVVLSVYAYKFLKKMN